MHVVLGKKPIRGFQTDVQFVVVRVCKNEVVVRAAGERTNREEETDEVLCNFGLKNAYYTALAPFPGIYSCVGLQVLPARLRLGTTFWDRSATILLDLHKPFELT